MKNSYCEKEQRDEGKFCTKCGLSQQNDTDEVVQIHNVNGIEFKMVKVSGGTFQMGATSEQGDDANSDEKPVHSVTLSDYHIGQTEVTQELWNAVMDKNPSFANNKQMYYIGDVPEEEMSETSSDKYKQCPVDTVSWNDCQEFIQKLNELTGKQFRLPTEAEWEFAARGGNKSKGYKYSGGNIPETIAWYTDNSKGETQPVAQKQANELGLYDMSGSVWEWCNDKSGDYFDRHQTNPAGSPFGDCCILRGGSWCSPPTELRVSARVDCYPKWGLNNFGFRLAL